LVNLSRPLRNYIAVKSADGTARGICILFHYKSALLQRSESDLTIVISNIIKANNQLKARIRAGKTIEPNDLRMQHLEDRSSM